MGKGKRNKQKGSIAEQIVANVFSGPDVQVRRNVRLPSIRRKGGTGGVREFDVLITGKLAGQTVHFAIECKNRASKVDSPAIDAYIGKLLDVGLPTQTSLFVSTSGFTRQAVERATEVGMKTLILNGLDPSRTKNLVFEAVQSHIFMLCSIKEIQFKTADNEDSVLYTVFHDKEGHYKGSLPDHLWKAWTLGTPPMKCARYSYAVTIPEEWKFLPDGRENSIHDLRVDCQVSAMIMQFPGNATTHRLVDASTGNTERQTWNVKYSDQCGDFLPKTFDTETEIERFLAQPARVKLTMGRIRLPKLVMSQGFLWPAPGSFIESCRDSDQNQSNEKFLNFASSEENNFWDIDGEYTKFLDTVHAVKLERIDKGGESS